MRFIVLVAAIGILAGLTSEAGAAGSSDDASSIDLDAPVVADDYLAEESNPAPMPEYVVTVMVVERDGAISDCVVERAEGAGAEAMAGFCEPGGYYDPILDEDGKPERVRIRFMSRVVHEPLPD